MRRSFLSRIPLFSTLDPDELDQLLDTTTQVTVEAGDYLFRRGEQGDALYIVEKGLMEAVIDEETGSERTLNLFFPGDFFGEMSLLTQEPRSASLRAITGSQLIRLSQEQFNRLLENKPRAALHLSKVLSSYLSRTNTHLSARKARISTLIPVGDFRAAVSIAAELPASLEGQFGEPAVLVVLGDLDLLGAGGSSIADLGAIGESQPLPSGGSVLQCSSLQLTEMDDQAVAAMIHSLRIKFGHIVVWARPEEARKRAAFLGRFDQTFYIAAHPYNEQELRKEMFELRQALGGRSRAVFIAPRGAALPMLLDGPETPIRMTSSPGLGGELQEGIDRLGRATAGITIGLALGSGTAQGLAHLGVMKALLEADIPIDLIAGTSGGALYGSLYASGLTIEEAVHIVVHHTRRNLIDKLDFTIPRRGLIRGTQIERMVQSCIGDITFAELAIPLRAAATDLDTGEEVVIKEGLVYQGVRASISVPGIFEPYSLDGRVLVDGVVVNPLPVSIARSMGADLVVAVQVPAPGKVTMEAGARISGKRVRNEYGIFASIVRAHHFVGDRLADKSAAEADVFIKPDVTRFGWREYSAAPEIIAAGYQAGQEAAARILELIGGMKGR